MISHTHTRTYTHTHTNRLGFQHKKSIRQAVSIQTNVITLIGTCAIRNNRITSKIISRNDEIMSDDYVGQQARGIPSRLKGISCLYRYAHMAVCTGHQSGGQRLCFTYSSCSLFAHTIYVLCCLLTRVQNCLVQSIRMASVAPLCMVIRICECKQQPKINHRLKENKCWIFNALLITVYLAHSNA